MKLSDEGRAFLESLEGREYRAYQDSGGVWTIGVGHRLTKSELHSGKVVFWDGVGKISAQYREGLTDAEIDGLLIYDLLRFENVASNIPVALTQPQFDALVCFCFNIGVSAFQNSTLLRLLSMGKYGEVPAQMRRWVYDNGTKVGGLIKRREREIDLWNKERAPTPVLIDTAELKPYIDNIEQVVALLQKRLAVT